ncbi:MAG: alpha/beta hydrolase [Pseudomonadota bacterium]
MKFGIDGANINYALDGPEDAPLVVHWNGASCALGMWDEAIPRISDRFRSLRFDARGIGSSSPATNPDADYTFERYVADVNAIVDSLGVAQYHIWSMAWGSRAAIAHISQCPERILSAAIYDANLEAADVQAQRDGHKEAVRRQVAAGIERFPTPPGTSANDHTDQVPLATAAAGKFDYSHALEKITMPIIFATGDCDPNLPFTKKLVDALSHAKFVEMENVGHGSVIQLPDLTSEIFLDFHRSIGTIS